MLEFAFSIFYKTSYSISNRIIENLTMRFPYGIAEPILPRSSRKGISTWIAPTGFR